MAAKKKKPAPQAKVDPEPSLTRFQAFRTVRKHRREISGAPYNPRTITEENRKALRANLDSDNGGVGLLGPVTVNALTGNLVGGHQRLAILDALEGHDNYLLDVAVVELTEAQEREQNLALNNQNLQGDWDMKLLADVLKTPELSLKATGFTAADIQLNFDDPVLAGMFTPNEATSKLLGAVKAIQDDGKPVKLSAGAPVGGSSAPDSDERGNDETKPHREREVMKRTRGENAENYAADDTETYAVVMFETRAEREAFMAFLNEVPESKYTDGRKLMARLGAELPPPAPKAKARGRKASAK